MIALSVLAGSTVLQLAAALQAIRLIQSTGWLFAWMLIAASVILMAVSRALTAYQTIESDGQSQLDLTTELFGLAISIFMLAGISLIRPKLGCLRQAEATLQEREGNYRAIIDNMTDTFYRTDADGHIVMASKSAERLLGYTGDELLGMRLEQLYVDPLDRDLFIAALKNSGGRLASYQAQLRHRDGQPVAVETNARLLRDGNGKVLGVEGTARDVSERRRMEGLNARLGRIIDESLNEIYVFDSETLKFILVNLGARRNLGYSMVELRKLTPLDLKPELDAAQFEDLLKPLRSGQRRMLNFETVHQRKDGSIYPVEVQLQLADSEQPPMFFAVIQDTTQRKRIEHAMMSALTREQDANAAKSKFLANMSHELRTPLNAVIGFSDMIGNERLGPVGNQTYKEYAHDIEASAQHLLSVINDILDLTRVNSGNVEMRESDVGLADMIEACRRMTAGQARENQQELVVRPIDRAIHLFADGRLLQQVVINLLTNAIKFSPVGSRIEVTAHIDDKGGLSLQVADQGIGMTEEELAIAFEPFSQARSSMTRTHEGVGLGLALSRTLVEMHGGHMALDSVRNVGTTATVWLPAERLRNGAEDSRQLAAQARP